MTAKACEFVRDHMEIGDGGCWNWVGRYSWAGYGATYFGGKHWRAHRLSYEAFVGPIGDKHVLHRCDNPRCVNPAHLWLGLPADNAADKARKGRTGREKRSGEKNVNAKLTDDDIRNIRTSNATGGALARQLGVSRALVNMVRRNEIWSHVK